MPGNLIISQPFIAGQPAPIPPYITSFNTPNECLTACVDQLTNSGQYDDTITSERARIIEKISIATPDPDAALAFIAAVCADWGIRIKSTDDTKPPMDRTRPILQTLDQLADVYGTPVRPKRLYAVITEHDGKTGMELFDTPAARRASLLERIGNLRGSEGPVPARFADDDEKLALLLTALLLPDEVRLAESVWDPELVFYRPDPSRG